MAIILTQASWSQDPFMLLKISKNVKEVLFMQSYLSWYLQSWKIKQFLKKNVC